MREIDLHIHTTASDGTCTPREAVRRASELGLRAIAVTDLILSGHNHGGIIRLPFAGGVLGNNGELFPEYDGGVYLALAEPDEDDAVFFLKIEQDEDGNDVYTAPDEALEDILFERFTEQRSGGEND